ncbi:MAG: BclA C-terminal domain-containing protein [Massiliimalia sp.]
MANYNDCREPTIRCVCSCPPCCPAPMPTKPATGYFYTVSAQSFSGQNVPVTFSNTAALNETQLGADGSTITVSKPGLYRIGYGITPKTGAGAGVTVSLASVSPATGTIPGTAFAVLLDQSQVHGDVLTALTPGQQICLQVSASGSAPLTLDTSGIGAYLTLTQVM